MHKESVIMATKCAVYRDVRTEAEYPQFCRRHILCGIGSEYILKRCGITRFKSGCDTNDNSKFHHSKKI